MSNLEFTWSNEDGFPVTFEGVDDAPVPSFVEGCQLVKSIVSGLESITYADLEEDGWEEKSALEMGDNYTHYKKCEVARFNLFLLINAD